MVKPWYREEAARSMPSLLMERMRRSVKAAPLPTTAASQIDPALSAREANRSPVTSNTGFIHFISFIAILALSLLADTIMVILASPSDKALNRIHPSPSGNDYGKGREA